MQISLKSKQFDLGESLTAYVNETLERTITKYFENAISANVTFTKSGDSITADISAHPVAHVMIQSSHSNIDAYTAFDEAINKLGSQLAKQKDKMTDYTNENKDTF